MKKSFSRNMPYLLLAAFTVIPQISLATRGGMDSSKESIEQDQARAVMGNVYEAYTKLLPFIYTTNPELSSVKMGQSKELLIKNLTDLSEVFKSAKHADFFKRPGFRPSLESINNHLEETILSVQTNNTIFAQKRLNVIGALCVTCHSQIPQSVAKKAFSEHLVNEKRESFDSDLSFANYLFLVRRFDEARTYFDKAINEALEKNSRYTHQELVSALKSELSIDTKISFNFDKAQTHILKWSGDKRLSNNDHKMLIRWKSDLENWKNFKSSEVLSDDKSIQDFINKYLVKHDIRKEIFFSGEDDVTFFITSGILLHHLVEKPTSTMAPEILYWLSLIDHRMSSTYFFSLGDLYLKDCITKYPSSPYAKKCYQEYAESIEAGYSGSGGTDIPADEKKELVRLKSLLK